MNFAFIYQRQIQHITLYIHAVCVRYVLPTVLVCLLALPQAGVIE